MTELKDALVKYFRDKDGPVILLESQSQDHPESRISYLAALPEATIRVYGNSIVIQNGDQKVEKQGNPWKEFSNFYASHKSWLFGYLGYDLKNSLEDLESKNPDPVNAPDLFFMKPSLLVKFQRDQSYEVIRGSLPTGFEPKKFDGIQDFSCGPLHFSVQKEDYLASIREAQRRIREGDFYEINLSHQLYADCSGDPYTLYRQMKKIGPVPFGAFIDTGKFSVCCLSPERFLKKEGRKVISQPIKGTAARGQDEQEDRSLREALQASPKEKAENLMIVDLVRHDLGRIAEKGSVQVKALFDIQSFGTVHQMVSTIEAQSAVDDPVEILQACYPMGSMTGAPKISAMKTIEELESYRRGIYSGAIGYLDPAGNFDFNVVIRSAIIAAHRLYYPVGGAITGDSVPEEEWKETLLKARALTKLMESVSQ